MWPNRGGTHPLTLASRCGSADPLFRPGDPECMRRRIPQGSTTRSRGGRLQNDRGFFIETPDLDLCNKQRAPRRRRLRRQPRADKAHSDRNDEPTRLTATVCASRPNNSGEIRGWTDRNTTRTRYRQPMAAGRPALPAGREKDGEIGPTPQERGSATNSAEQNVWSNCRPVTTLTHIHGVVEQHVILLATNRKGLISTHS